MSEGKNRPSNPAAPSSGNVERNNECLKTGSAGILNTKYSYK